MLVQNQEHDNVGLMNSLIPSLLTLLHHACMRSKAMIPSTEFKFDEVLRQQSTQGDVYAAAVEPVVADVLNGYNGTVMAYGQTGTMNPSSICIQHARA